MNHIKILRETRYYTTVLNPHMEKLEIFIHGNILSHGHGIGKRWMYMEV